MVVSEVVLTGKEMRLFDDEALGSLPLVELC